MAHDYVEINDILSARHEFLSDFWTTITNNGDVIYNLENGDTATININDDLTVLPDALNDAIAEYEDSMNAN
jgi:hypothetical protein